MIPKLWARRAVEEMSQTLLKTCKSNRDLCSLQAQADFKHLVYYLNNDYHKTMKAVHDYVKRDMPLSFILKEHWFGDLRLKVRPPVLIPRIETEHWINQLLLKEHDLSNMRILDVGTGSGCIALAIAKAFPSSSVVGIDISKRAITLARLNALGNKVGNAYFIRSSFKAFATNLQNVASFDLIVSNPPYIPHSRRLPKSVRCFEDRCALYSGPDGMQMINEILSNYTCLLRPCSNDGSVPYRLIIEFDSPNHERLPPEILIRPDQFNVPRTMWI